MGLLETPLRYLVIGAGQRGVSYARPLLHSKIAQLYAVAEPVDFRRKSFGELYIWGSYKDPEQGQEFSSWIEWLAWEIDRRARAKNKEQVPPGVDGVFVCTLDDTHVEILTAIAPLKLHVLCEKPLATSLEDCLKIYEKFQAQQDEKIFSVGHVLRYSPHNLLLRNLLIDKKVVGDVLSIEHTEPVGWWHFAHSYVRGNWRRETKRGDGSLLTKCSHDVDFLLWLLSQPGSAGSQNRPSQSPRLITSVGSRNQFRKSRKPPAAASATNCLSCPIERSCQYSALQIYDDHRLEVGYTHWLNHVVHDIEDVIASAGKDAARKKLHAALAQDFDARSSTDDQIASRPWYGRCVWEGDNTVCDDQVVTITFAPTLEGPHQQPGKTAILHMIANTEKECERRGVVYGTKGELSYDGETIRYFDFNSRISTILDAPKQPLDEKIIKSHGGGDGGLANAFVTAVHAVERDGYDVRRAQEAFVGCTLDDAIQAHALVFAAEEARREEKVIRWSTWWKAALAK
jgi:predicted dehydrogenase